MPVFGLPNAVEGALHNLLTAGQVSTWKIQGQGNTTTLTLKFRENEEGAMAEQKNVYYKKKSRGQIQREQRRTEGFRAKRKQRNQKSNLLRSSLNHRLIKSL